METIIDVAPGVEPGVGLVRHSESAGSFEGRLEGIIPDTRPRAGGPRAEAFKAPGAPSKFEALKAGCNATAEPHLTGGAPRD